MIGRSDAKAALTGLLEDVSRSQASVLTLVGEPGIGKTLLCAYAAEAATAAGFFVVEAAGVQWESGFQLAALSQILRSLYPFAEQLPGLQRAQVDAALGLNGASAPDRFALAVATHGCLVRAAEERPLLLVIDDTHWLDATSVGVLTFALRRLHADAVAVVLARRSEHDDPFPETWPRHLLRPLQPGEVRELIAQLRPELPAVARAVVDQIADRLAGNPLAIHELAPLLSPEHATGSRPLPDPPPLGKRGQLSFGGPIGLRPERTRRALAVTAAAGSRTVLVPPALTMLGLEISDLDAAVEAGMLTDTPDYHFTHPLRRAAAYAGVPVSTRRSIHATLADLTRVTDAERHAWHLDASGADRQAVADAMEAAAVEITRRAGAASAAATWARGADLTTDRAARDRRSLNAAAAYFLAGDHDPAEQRLTEILDGPAGREADNELVAEALLLQCRLAVWYRTKQADLPPLERTLDRLSALDRSRALIACTQVAGAYQNFGLNERGYQLGQRALELSEGMPDQFRLEARCLAAHTTVLARGGAAVAPISTVATTEAITALAEHNPIAAWAVPQIAQWQEEFDFGLDVSQIVVASMRRHAAVAWLPYALTVQAELRWWTGSWNHARAAITEGLQLAEEAGQGGLIGYSLAVAAMIEASQDRREDCERLAHAAVELADRTTRRPVLIYAYRALGLLELGAGRPVEASQHLLRAHRVAIDVGMAQPTVVAYIADLVEALIRSGDRAQAADVLSELEAAADRSQSRWAAATLLRCRALLHPDCPHSEAMLGESIDQLTSTLDVRFERHRSQLALGELLRRQRKLSAARQHLSSAAEGFRQLGAPAWSRRADAERRAAGGRGADDQQPRPSGPEALTSQQLQVVLMVAGGATNREAAAALFLSPKTVDYHLRRACTTLGVRTRVELARLVAAGALNDLGGRHT